MPESYKASAPGSLMLMGEHAVLYGSKALACAVDSRIEITLTPKKENQISIISKFGEYKTDLSQINFEQPYAFVLASIKEYQQKLNTGFELNIKSEFSHKVGLGSSAAITASTVGVLNQWLQTKYDQQKLHSLGLKAIHSVQCAGSGTDLAASIFGGVVEYCGQQKNTIKHESLFPITLVYSGKKLPTKQVIQLVKQKFESRKSELEEIIQQIKFCTEEGIHHYKNNHLAALADAFQAQQKWMNELGVNDHDLQNIIDTLDDQKEILGSKISGSGLGDCVVGIGKINQNPFDDRLIPVQMSAKGLEVSTI